MNELVSPVVPFAGKSYIHEGKDCIVPVAQAILIATSNTDPRVPLGCLLIRAIRRLTYGEQTVCIPVNGFGLRHLSASAAAAAAKCPLHLLNDPEFTGSDDVAQGFVPIDKNEPEWRDVEDAVHASPDTLFLVPEWWVQPVAYFRQGRGFEQLGFYNDAWCAQENCQLHEEEAIPSSYCDGCPRIFHHACLAVVPSDDADQEWMCPVCEKHAQMACRGSPVWRHSHRC